MRKSSAKGALITSAISLLLCFVMLLGTTFAWFTDEVTSTNNKIQAGTLNIDMLVKDVDESTDKFVSVKENKDAIFNYTNWEPGFVMAKNIKVTTSGTLALKYSMSLVPYGEVEELADVVEIYYKAELVENFGRDLEAAGLVKLGTLRDVLDGAEGTVLKDELMPDSNTEDYATIALKMIETAGNEYQGTKIGTTFDINLFATQYTYEEDSFDENYDEDSKYAVIVGKDGVQFEDSGFSFSVPKEAVEDGMDTLVPQIRVDEGVYIIPDSISETLLYKIVTEIDIKGIKENNTAPIVVKYVVPGTEDFLSVEVYHNDEKIDGATYDPATRTVTFTATSFSPYTFIFDIGATVIPEEYTNDEAIKMLTDAEDGAIIDGNGRKITFADNVVNQWSFLIQNGVTFRNMTLSAKGAGSTVMVYGKDKNIKMKNVTFENTSIGKKALEISTNSRKSFVLEDCTIKGKPYVQGDNVTFIRCSFNTNMNLESANNITMKDCTFNVSGAITMNTKLQNILIEDCEFKYTNAIRLYAGMPQPTNVQLINNTYKTTLVDPDTGVDYNGWIEAGAWIEEGNIKN